MAFQTTHKSELKCDLCAEDFTSMRDYMQHTTQVHSDPKPFRCSTCQRKFATTAILLRHISTHSQAKTIQCSFCTETFTCKSKLKLHLRKHSQKFKQNCKHCGEKFASKQTLENHLIRHTEANMYTCEICNHVASDRFKLANHVRIHTGEKPFKCSLCPKQFAQKSNLRLHEKRHGLKKFACSDCSFRASWERNLLDHVATSHPVKKNSSCKSTISPKSIKNKFHLTKDTNKQKVEKPYLIKTKISKEFKCPNCEKSFSKKQNLNIHLRRHRRQNVVNCNFCPAEFCTEQELTQHIQSHTGEKPHTCSVCGNEYTKATYLKHHMREAHHLQKEQKNYLKFGTDNCGFTQANTIVSELRIVLTRL